MRKFVALLCVASLGITFASDVEAANYGAQRSSTSVQRKSRNPLKRFRNRRANKNAQVTEENVDSQQDAQTMEENAGSQPRRQRRRRGLFRRRNNDNVQDAQVMGENVDSQQDAQTMVENADSQQDAQTTEENAKEHKKKRKNRKKKGRKKHGKRKREEDWKDDIPAKKRRKVALNLPSPFIKKNDVKLVASNNAENKIMITKGLTTTPLAPTRSLEKINAKAVKIKRDHKMSSNEATRLRQELNMYRELLSNSTNAEKTA